MLPSTPHVEGTYLGADGMLENAQSGGLYIDCSTIDPVASKVRECACPLCRLTFGMEWYRLSLSDNTPLASPC